METSENLPEPNSSRSTSSAADTLASPSVKPGDVPAPTIPAIFGRSSTDWFASFDPEACYWKTCQGTFLLDLERFSETWPDSGMTRNGFAFEHQTLERPTSESGSSRWPTARQEDGESCGNHPGATDSLTGATRNWPTPDAQLMNDGADPVNHAARIQRLKDKGINGNGEGITLAMAVRTPDKWPTPAVPNGGRTSNTADTREDGSKRQIDLGAIAPMWQTPATDSFRSRGGDRKDEMGLDQQARFFPTPAERDYRTPNKKTFRDRGGETKGEQLQNFVEHSPLVQTIPDGEPSSNSGQTSRRRLNPRFVEWLMGFPPGWTEL